MCACSKLLSLLLLVSILALSCSNKSTNNSKKPEYNAAIAGSITVDFSTFPEDYYCEYPTFIAGVTVRGPLNRYFCFACDSRESGCSRVVTLEYKIGDVLSTNKNDYEYLPLGKGNYTLEFSCQYWKSRWDGPYSTRTVVVSTIGDQPIILESGKITQIPPLTLTP